MLLAMHDNRAECAAVLAEIEAERKASQAIALEIVGVADALHAASARVERSWSGSWIGYHSRLYFGAFDQPPRSFDVEWGGLHLPDGWSERTPVDVYATIEADASHSADEIESQVAALRERALACHTRVCMALAVATTRAEFEREQELLMKLEDIDWQVPASRFLSPPKAVMTRDREALSQGLQVPPHFAYRARVLVVEAEVQIIDEFYRLADRALRQVIAKLPAEQPTVSHGGCPGERGTSPRALARLL